MSINGAKLDRKDLDIISLYCEKSDISQDEIAKKVGMSQPSIALRVKRLKNSGILTINTGLDVFKAGFHIAKVDATATNATKILKMFRGCPYFLNGYTTSGKNNLCLFFVGEKISTLESIVDNHLRANNDVQNVEFNLVIDATKSPVMLLKKFGKSNTPPCGTLQECSKCTNFQEGSCLGCPAINQYEGVLWASH